MDLQFELYRPAHRNACLAIFRSNVPEFFHTAEEPEFQSYLDEKSAGNYFLVLAQGAVIACGGIWAREDGVGRLVWGMVERGHHREGYGRALIEYRLKLLAENPGVKRIQVDTSQHNPGFFAKFGFRELQKTADAFAPGLDSHVMQLTLDDKTRRRLLG